MFVKGAAFVILFLAAHAEAMPEPIVVKPGQVAPLQSGVSVGGQAGIEFSLIGVHAEPLKRASGERLVLSYGDRVGGRQMGEPGFFHIAVDRDGRRVVIDLAQLRKTAVDPQKLARVLANSKLVEASEMTTDPVDGATNITLNLKVPAFVRVTAESSGPARLVLDLEPRESKGERL